MKQTNQAFGYVRVSSKVQVEKDGIRRQKQGIEDWCARNSVQLLKIFYDKGVSAALGANRDTGTFAQMVKEAKAGMLIVMEDNDRLGRDETIPALMFQRDLVSKGFRIVFCKTGIEVNAQNFNDPAILLPNFMAQFVGKFENQKKMERVGETWAKKRKATANGVALGDNGPAWVTYHPETKSFTKNQRAEMVVRLFEGIAAGKGIRTLACELNSKHVPSFGRGKQNKGAGWSSTHIKRILTSRIVLGEYAAHTVANKTKRHRDESIPVVSDYYPRIIEPALFYRVQEILNTHKSNGSPKKNATNLFTGLVTCSLCGGPLHVKNSPMKRNNKNYQYFTLYCANAKRRKKCNKHGNIQLRHVERAVLSILWSKVVPQMSAANNRAERLEVAKQELAVKEQAYNNLMTVIEKAGMDEFVTTRLTQLRNERAGLKSEVEQLEALREENPMLDWEPCEPTLENRMKLQDVLRAEIESLVIDVPNRAARLSLKDPQTSFEIDWNYTKANHVKPNHADAFFTFAGEHLPTKETQYVDNLFVWKTPETPTLDEFNKCPVKVGGKTVSMKKFLTMAAA